jgi:hypothetical protein
MMQVVYSARVMEPHRDEIAAKEIHDAICRNEAVERDLQSLRDGTSRYSTPREDAILLGVCGTIFAILITLICICIHYASQIDHWGLK